VRGYQLKPKAEADNPCGDLDYSGYHKNEYTIGHQKLSACIAGACYGHHRPAMCTERL